MFEPLWNRSMIDNIQITVAETVGVEKRAGYYEKSGALRDMVPNHCAELLSLVAMEPPVSFSAEHMRDKQVELLASVRRIKPEEVADYAVRGQYGPGQVAGKDVPGYRQDPGRRARLGNRNLRGHARRNRQLALVGHTPFYHPHRQAPDPVR